MGVSWRGPASEEVVTLLATGLPKVARCAPVRSRPVPSMTDGDSLSPTTPETNLLRR